MAVRQPEADESTTVRFECSNCGTPLQSSRKLVGYPEVCSKCMSATLVTDERLRAQLVKQKSSYQMRRDYARTLQVLFFLGVAATVVRKTSEVAFGLETLLLGLAFLGGFALVASVFINPSRKASRKWILDRRPTTERKRKEVCGAVLELRSKGKPAMLCDECGGTGHFVAYCRKCNGRGYSVRKVGRSDLVVKEA